MNKWILTVFWAPGKHAQIHPHHAATHTQTNIHTQTNTHTQTHKQNAKTYTQTQAHAQIKSYSNFETCNITSCI